ncbi:penicillin acylase family protein [Aridibaculum aurantiacum]|uniref:penicillin acylase family protein n=1 Tax=Aridibaculum aurantiacum TaxID=2810307 RepID=UPI001A977BF7|nr:penicillin acylase family protein [Aridibaculum aurantiacum]
MRFVAFLVSLFSTIGLIYILNIQLHLAGTTVPPLGKFLSPQHGFWQNAESRFTEPNGELKLAGLQGKVDVYFDERLVPHVYADNERDAYFVQGYLHAKYRLWQMDFQTYAAGGRLSEIMGEKVGETDFLALDRFFRRLGMVYGAEQSLKEMEANAITKLETDAYTAGVNSYIQSLQPHQLPLEYKLLNYAPEPWTNMKTALFLKYMSYDLAGSEWDFEMSNAKQLFSAEDFELLYPAFQDFLDPMVPKGTVFQKAGLALTKPASADSLYFGRKAQLESTLVKPDKDNGSNNWAVAGSKTQSGRPILCNDPHLGLNLPSLWYEMQLTTPTFSSYGATFPGSPAIIIGFNDSSAWGFTNAMRDVRDYYEIQFRDSSMQEYMYNGSWHKSTFRTEVIKVKGKPDVVERIAMTVFGPVMYDHKYENKLGDKKYYAVKWKAHEGSNELLTFTMLNRAHNYDDYKQAISTYQTPGQNMLFATKTGDIAITQQGAFPAKWFRQGDFPMPGTDSSYLWEGDIPANENPMMLNPPRGFVSSANQLPVDNTYPYYLGGSYPVYRGVIINRLLNQMNNITPNDMMQLQTNNYNVFAEMARPVLVKYMDAGKLADDEKELYENFVGWNLYNDPTSEGATIFKVWWDSLEAEVWGDEFAQTKLPLRWPDEGTLLEAITRDSSFKFIDDIRTPTVETINEKVLTAFKSAAKELKIASAKNNLAWAKYKDTGVRHLLRTSALGRLHLPIGGGEHIINATKRYHGPSWRMVVHLTDEIEAYGVYPGGQSGNPGSKYYDTFINNWADGKFYKLLFIKQSQAANHPAIKWKITFTP